MRRITSTTCIAVLISWAVATTATAQESTTEDFASVSPVVRIANDEISPQCPEPGVDLDSGGMVTTSYNASSCRHTYVVGATGTSMVFTFSRRGGGDCYFQQRNGPTGSWGSAVSTRGTRTRTVSTTPGEQVYFSVRTGGTQFAQCVLEQVTNAEGPSDLEGTQRLKVWDAHREQLATNLPDYFAAPTSNGTSYANGENAGTNCPDASAAVQYAFGTDVGDGARVNTNTTTTCVYAVGQIIAGQHTVVLNHANNLGTTGDRWCSWYLRKSDSGHRFNNLAGYQAEKETFTPVDWATPAQPGVNYDVMLVTKQLDDPSKFCVLQYLDGVSGAQDVGGSGGSGATDDPFDGQLGDFTAAELPPLEISRPPISDCWSQFDGADDFLNLGNYGNMLGCLFTHFFVPSDGIFQTAAQQLGAFAGDRVPLNWSIELFGAVLTFSDGFSSASCGSVDMADPSIPGSESIGSSWSSTLCSGPVSTAAAAGTVLLSGVIWISAAKKIWAGAPWNTGKETV